MHSEKGYSTETALTDAVDDTERAILRGQSALGVSLDISGAFDNLPSESVLTGLRERGVDPMLWKWFENYLNNRYAKFLHKGAVCKRKLRTGTPQGGVLSPLLRNVGFDKLLELFDQSEIRIKGHADDALLLILGPDPHSVVKKMQVAINKAVEWGRQNNLLFNPNKTVAVLFSRKIPPLKLLRVGTVAIPYSDSMRYLGVQLDKRLTWSAHINAKIKSAKATLFKLKGIIGNRWGPIPRLLQWAYSGIVVPALCYGCIVWGCTLNK